MQAVLMVAGKSTRTYPLTLTRPKPLLPILNLPLICHSLNQLDGLFDEIILITGYKQDKIKAFLGNNYKSLRIIYQEQKEQLGTGHAVLQARPHIKGKFVAMNGDDLFARQDLQELLKYDYAALAKRVSNPEIYGVFQVDNNNKIQSLVEKPKHYIGDLVNIGCYVLLPEFFDRLEKTTKSDRGEIEITSTIDSAAKECDFFAVPTKGFWLPTGYAWDLLKHQEYLSKSGLQSNLEGVIENGAVLKGAVNIGKGTLIKAGSYIEGPVMIGNDCIIGPNCYIRKYSSVGHNCCVGNAVEIKNSIVMNNTSISHLSYIGDSIIGEGCNIGAGTITANLRHDKQEVKSMVKGKLIDTGLTKLGAIISDGAMIGINSNIYPGRKIWPNIQVRPVTTVDRDIIPDNFKWE